MPRTGNQFQEMDDTSDVPESLDEWEQIQFSFPKLPPTSVEQDMVVTRDNNYLNDNHEGLQEEVPPVLDLELEATQDPDLESGSSSSVSSNSRGDEENGRLSQPQVAKEIRRGLRLRLDRKSTRLNSSHRCNRPKPPGTCCTIPNSTNHLGDPSSQNIQTQSQTPPYLLSHLGL